MNQTDPSVDSLPKVVETITRIWRIHSRVELRAVIGHAS
jgi:hypothetical protein